VITVERDKLVTMMNEDLATEYQSIVQYVQHVATLHRPEYLAVVEELRKHVGQELEHAITLAEQIDFLGGVPGTHVPEIRPAKDPKTALEMDLELEEGQLERYRERVQQCDDMGLPDVAEAIRPILQQTQDHVIDLRAALEQA
jgi:bacterioferritin